MGCEIILHSAIPDSSRGLSTQSNFSISSSILVTFTHNLINFFINSSSGMYIQPGEYSPVYLDSL